MERFTCWLFTYSYNIKSAVYLDFSSVLSFGFSVNEMRFADYIC